MNEYLMVVDFINGHYITSNGVVVCKVSSTELAKYVTFCMRLEGDTEKKKRVIAIYMMDLIINRGGKDD